MSAATARERVLDLALREAHGALGAPDVTQCVLDVVRGRSRPRRSAASRPASPRRRWLRAVAAVLIVGVPLAWLLLRVEGPPGVPSPVARSTQPMRILDAAGTERRGDRLESGDVAVLEGPDSGRITLWTGARLIAADSGLVRTSAAGGQPVAQLLEGRVRVENVSRGPLTVESGAGTFLVAPGAVAIFEAHVRPEHDPAVVAARTGPRATGRMPPAVPVFVEVQRGTVSGTGRDRETARAGQLLCASPGMGRQLVRLPAEISRVEIDQRLLHILSDTWVESFQDQDAVQRSKNASMAMSALRRIVRAEQAEATYLAAILRYLPADTGRPDARQRVLELLARDGAFRGRAALVAALTSEPDAFDHNTLLLTAEHGVDQATTLLAERFAGNMPWRNQILVAAFFAYRGDARGRDLLVDATRRLNVEFMNVNERLATAAGLHNLGDPSPWRVAMREVEAKVESMLSNDNLVLARRYAHAATYFHRALAGAQTVSLAHLVDQVRWIGEELKVDLSTPEKIRTYLATLVE